MGADGNLIHEFMEMERIILEQSQSIGSSKYQRGSYQPYVCRVAGKIGTMGINYECLDIASPKTLSNTVNNATVSQWNTTHTTVEGQLNANKFVHSNIMVDLNNNADQISDSEHLFGYNVTACDENDSFKWKIMGDGVINSFDLFVLAAVQFRQGPYSALAGETPFAAISTTQGRPDTTDRCCMDKAPGACPEFDRLQWQRRVAFRDCYSFRRDEAAYNESRSRSRRLQETHGLAEYTTGTANVASAWGWPQAVGGRPPAAPASYFAYNSHPNEYLERSWSQSGSNLYTSVHPTPASNGWSTYGIYNVFNATHATAVQTTSLQNTAGALEEPRADSAGWTDLGAQIFGYSVTTQGAWYWINIPSVHLSVELTVSSLGLHEGIPISNDRSPNYGEPRIPYTPETYHLRFIRHREFYGLDATGCSTIKSSRRATNAMENGVIYVSQSLGEDDKLCGFDLMLWKPAVAHTAIEDGGSVCILSGSMGMTGSGGSVQRTTHCAGHTNAMLSDEDADTDSELQTP